MAQTGERQQKLGRFQRSQLKARRKNRQAKMADVVLVEPRHVKHGELAKARRHNDKRVLANELRDEFTDYGHEVRFLNQEARLKAESVYHLAIEPLLENELVQLGDYDHSVLAGNFASDLEMMLADLKQAESYLGTHFSVFQLA
jgi:hypothetical protein